MTVLAFATGTYVLRLVGHACQTKGIAPKKTVKTVAWRQRALPDPIQPENRLGGETIWKSPTIEALFLVKKREARFLYVCAQRVAVALF